MLIFIYSRKSKWTGRGDSVENQLAMCREYIRHNIENSKDAHIVEYEDEGYSGKNTQRPQFQKMIHDIQTSACDYLICYKLDRLGRNIADLANLIEFLNQEKVSFVSIKERFDTSTPIGKAMLYFAGVLAQMEREQIAERVRDNMVMLARKGRWLGGNTPLGFTAKEEETFALDGKRKKVYRLTVNEEEIKIVRYIFRDYLENRSQTRIVKYFEDLNILTKRGKSYTATAIRDILTNPVYCTADQEAYLFFKELGCQVCFEEKEADGTNGLMSYAKTSSVKYKSRDNEPEKWIIAPGRHKGIIDGKEFIKIQNLLAANNKKGKSYRNTKNTKALLTGILTCSCGYRMRPKNYSNSQVAENGDRKFSYLCLCKEKTHGEKCRSENIQGNTLDDLVCKEVLKFTKEHAEIQTLLKRAQEKAAISKEIKVTDTDILKQEIEKKNVETQNLIKAIGKSGGDEMFVRQIEAEVSQISNARKELEMKLEKVRDEESFPSEYDDSLSSFEKLFCTLTIIEKREYLRILLDKVIWDGEKVHIFIRGSQ